MAIAVYSDAELVALSRMPEWAFSRQLARMVMRDALIFRRNLQVSLVSYSKRRRAKDAFDPVQAGIIKCCYLIEKLCRKTFLEVTYAKALKAKPQGMTIAQVKRDVLNKWEKLIARSSY